MSRPTYKRALADARSELQRLFRQREELERKIARTRQSVVALGRMCDTDDGPRALIRSTAERGMGLTDAVRTALMVARTPVDAKDVRAALETVGYDPGSSPNVLISIHTVIRRLRDAGEVKQVGRVFTGARTEGGPTYTRIAYWWGEFGIPKGWRTYPDKRLMKRWKATGLAANDDDKDVGKVGKADEGK